MTESQGLVETTSGVRRVALQVQAQRDATPQLDFRAGFKLSINHVIDPDKNKNKKTNTIYSEA